MKRLVAAACLPLIAWSGTAAAQSFPGPKVADAKPGEIRVIVTAAIKAPLEAIAEQAAKAVGRPLVIEYGSARGNLKKEILAGQDFEVAILLPDVDAELLAAGKIKPGAYGIASVPIAFGLRGEAPGLDLSTPEAVKKALLGARSVKYAPTGAALFTVRKVFATLGIASQIKDTSTLHDAVPLAPGEYELNIYPISEIIPNKALKNLGPVIPALQVPAVMDATIGVHAADMEAVHRLIRFLQGPAIDPGLKTSAMTKDIRNTK